MFLIATVFAPFFSIDVKFKRECSEDLRYNFHYIPGSSKNRHIQDGHQSLLKVKNMLYILVNPIPNNTVLITKQLKLKVSEKHL